MSIHHDQVGFNPGMQGLFNIHKSISMTHHVNKLKNKNHMIISIDAEKALTKSNIQNVGIEEICLSMIKAIYDKLTANIILNGEKLKAFHLRSETRQEYPLTPLSFKIVLEVLGSAIREEIKGILIGEEKVKQSLFADNMILYTENPKDTTRKPLELINEFGKVAGYKINTQESVVFLYTHKERSEREIKETIAFTIASKRIKYLGDT